MKTFETLMQEVYEGKRKAGELSEEHILATYEKLNQGAKSRYGKSYSIVNSDGTPNRTVVNMKQNLYKFSAAKDSVMMEKINNALYDGDRLKSLDEFMADVNRLNIQYNRNWLSTEYRTARQAAQTAAQWEAFQKNKELFPNLKYMTQQDNDVRTEHEALDGVIAPIDSSFWADNYPPNGWNCRCYVVQTAEPAWDKIPDTNKVVKPEFKGNTGISGQIFNENIETGHRFFALAEENPEWKKRFELSKLEAGYEKVKTPGGGNIKVSIYADPEDLEKNIEAAKTSLDVLNHQLNIRPHLDGFKNPEFIDKKGRWGDRVSPDWKTVKTATDNAFSGKLNKKRNGQLSELDNTFIVLEVNFKKTKSNKIDFITQSWSKFKHYKNLDYIIYYNKDQAVMIDRGIIEKGFEFYAKTIEKIL